MSSSKLIVILGATGNQGGSVAESFLSEPDWKVRAITRNSASSKAQTLTSKGAEIIQADLDDPSTLASAFDGAHAIFAVSDFWGLLNEINRSRAKPGQPLNEWAAEHEEQQLKHVIDAASKIPTLERFILSSLSHSEKWSRGKYTRVYHFDGKARAAEYIPRAHPADGFASGPDCAVKLRRHIRASRKDPWGPRLAQQNESDKTVSLAFCSPSRRPHCGESPRSNRS